MNQSNPPNAQTLTVIRHLFNNQELNSVVEETTRSVLSKKKPFQDIRLADKLKDLFEMMCDQILTSAKEAHPTNTIHQFFTSVTQDFISQSIQRVDWLYIAKIYISAEYNRQKVERDNRNEI